jgi:hypothetical protein
MAQARGKYAKAISDRSGMEFPYNEMVREWNGHLVHKSEFEAKHPQLELRSRSGDAQGLFDARPDRTEEDSDAFENPKGFDGITGANLAKSAGYSITVGKRDSSGNITNTTDFYHFTVDTNTATSGGVSGGGNSCSAGPATLTA